MSFWALVAMQIVAAFNMNLSKVLLVALGLWLAKRGQSFHGIEHIVAVALVVPYVLFSPTAGWLADRFPKHRVIRVSAFCQILLLGLLALCLVTHQLVAGILVFFALSTQAALLSTSKMSVIKELVGGGHMGFASGIIEGTVILAILGGQITGGNWFDAGLAVHAEAGWEAATRPVWWLIGLAMAGTVITWGIQATMPHSDERFSWRVATRHVRDLGEMLSDPVMRRCGIGVGFFWGFGGVLYLMVLQIAQECHGGGDQGTGSSFSALWAMAVVGIALGSVGAGLMSRKRIELGLSPMGGILMTAGTVALAFCRPETAAMKAMLLLTGAGGAVFLVPLQAVLQDRPAADKRGAVLSASNLVNNLLGIVAVALQFVFKNLVHLSLRGQFLCMGVLTLAFTLWVLRSYRVEFVRLLCLAVLRVVYRTRAVGAERVPAEGGVLLLPNHLSFGDAFFLSVACPRPVRFVMDAEFTRNPWIRAFTECFHTVPIATRNMRQAVLTTAAALQEGTVVCVFPEGQLSRRGTPCAIQRGFQWIAERAGCPVIPVWMDGVWGSVLSCEGGRFFGKFPRAYPLRQTVAFGTPREAAELDSIRLRGELYRQSAEAVTERFRAAEWSAKALPEVCGLLPMESWKSLWINGYQVGQVAAFAWKSSLAWLEGDDLVTRCPALIGTFPAQFGIRLRACSTVEPEVPRWVGGRRLRERLTAHPPSTPVVFFDFSDHADEPMTDGGIIHCPCLALDGRVIALSFPDPPQVLSTSNPQSGRKPGSHGVLLPGFSYETHPDGRVTLHGPALSGTGLVLPAGAWIDDEGFVFLSPARPPVTTE